MKLYGLLAFIILTMALNAESAVVAQNVQAPVDDFQVPPEPTQTQVPPDQLPPTQTIPDPNLQGQTPNQIPIPPNDQMTPAAPTDQTSLVVEIDPLLEGFFEDINYNPTDKRDPFLPYMNATQRLAKQGPTVPLEPLQKFALDQLKLIGIIWDVGRPKALIEDPLGKSHIIIENTKLGQEMGYVAAIREGEVIVVEQTVTPEGLKIFQTKVLKLSNLKGIQGETP